MREKEHSACLFLWKTESIVSVCKAVLLQLSLGGCVYMWPKYTYTYTHMHTHTYSDLNIAVPVHHFPDNVASQILS